MLTYSYCGLPVSSNLALPELPLSNQRGGLLLALKASQLQSRILFGSHFWHSPSGEIVLAYCQQDSNHWLRFPGLADFRISAGANEIFCYPLPEIPEETIRHLLLDQVLPRCLAYQGKVMVHASAVQLEQGVILFIGDSGVGKSTLAGNFHQAGNPAISDDCVCVKEKKEQITAVPNYGGLRLWEDSLRVLFAAKENVRSMAHYSTKRRVPLNENDLLKLRNGIPILAVIVLFPPGQSSSPEIILDQLSRREAFIEIGKQTFQLYLNDPGKISRHMQSLARIVGRMPSFRLSVPRDYDLLPIVRQKILEKVL